MDYSLKRRQRLLAGALLLLCPISMLAQARQVAPAAVDKNGKAIAVQDVVRTARPRGPVFVGVRSVHVFGLANNRDYCSPAIQVTNSSNAPIEELMVGINYTNANGKAAGGTLSRFTDIKVNGISVDEFYRLDASTCEGLTGGITVVRCKYETGDDCVKDVQPISVGPLPLQYKGG